MASVFDDVWGNVFGGDGCDKTQIAAMTMAAGKKRPWEVFIAASLALRAVTAIGFGGQRIGSILAAGMDQTSSRSRVHCHWGGLIGKFFWSAPAGRNGDGA